MKHKVLDVSLKKVIEDCIHDNGDNQSPLFIRAFLSVLSKIYGVAVGIRNFLYDRNILKNRDVPCRIVCIGNLTVGGTGKTPVVIMTASMLIDKGYSVAVVSRGYGGSSKDVTVVADTNGVLVSSDVSGDEPQIIAASLPGVPVVVGKDRFRAAEYACEKFHPKVIVLDDGFQHRRLDRNVDIVTIDARNPFGNECLLPRGILRESPSSMKRAKAAVVTRFDESVRKRIERMIRYYDRRIRIFFTKHSPVAFRVTGTAERLALDYCKGKRIAALSNIADPDDFYRSLESLGAEIVLKIAMPDHHKYTQGDIEKIENDAREANAELIVMTAKDEKNLPDGTVFSPLSSVVLDIEATLLEEHEAYFDLIRPTY